MTGEVEVDGRRLEVEVRPIDAGTLGLLRDVTAARELERSRREMQRMVSHELKTPLASIAGFGAMLERYELSRDEQLRVAGLIRGEADRLGDMVRSFLDLERLGSGRWEGERDAVDLAELVRTALRVAAARRRPVGPPDHLLGSRPAVAVIGVGGAPRPADRQPGGQRAQVLSAEGIDGAR